jgi:hypothetical protein
VFFFNEFIILVIVQLHRLHVVKVCCLFLFIFLLFLVTHCILIYL